MRKEGGGIRSDEPDEFLGSTSHCLAHEFGSQRSLTMCTFKHIYIYIFIFIYVYIHKTKNVCIFEIDVPNATD